MGLHCDGIVRPLCLQNHGVSLQSADEAEGKQIEKGCSAWNLKLPIALVLCSPTNPASMTAVKGPCTTKPG